MKVKFLWLFGLILLLSLVACGGSAALTPDPAASLNIAEGELELAQTIDVQTVADVMNRSDVVLIDVREQVEYDAGHIPGVTLIPLGEIASRMSEIPTDKTVIVTCRSGNRSEQAADFLRANGFDNIHNMAGGILAWERAGLPVDR
jgi:phage shock protein E